MIVTYFTDTYIKWAELFLNTLKETNGTKYKLLMNTRNLTDKQIDYISSIYPNSEIINKELSITHLSKKYNISEQNLIESRDDCANGKINGKFRLWITITAIIDRIETLLFNIKSYQKEHMFLHLDIDTIFGGNIDNFMNIAINYDIGLRLRKLYPLAGFVTIKNNYNGIGFVKKWVENIHTEPIENMINKVWGQVTLEKTRQYYKNDINMFEIVREDWENIIDVWIAKKKNKNVIYERLINDRKCE